MPILQITEIVQVDSIEKRAFNGTIIGFISMAVNVVYSIVLVPFFLTYWGDIKYGHFIGIYALIQLMRTLDAGHQSFIGNKFILYFHSNPLEAKRVLGSSIAVAFTIGFIELIL